MPYHLWYGIIPAWVVLCHTTWLENSKREWSMKGRFPPVVFRNQFEWRWAQRAQTTRVTEEEELEVLIEERLPKETERHQNRSGPGAGRECIQITHWTWSSNSSLFAIRWTTKRVYRPQNSFPRSMVVSRIQRPIDLFVKWRPAGLTGQLFAAAARIARAPIWFAYFGPPTVRIFSFFHPLRRGGWKDLRETSFGESLLTT